MFIVIIYNNLLYHSGVGLIVSLSVDLFLITRCVRAVLQYQGVYGAYKLSLYSDYKLFFITNSFQPLPSNFLLNIFHFYSNIIEMASTFNCLLLGDNEIILPISIFKDNYKRFVMFGREKINFNTVTVLLLRKYICEAEGVGNFNNMKLWKLKEVKHGDIKDKNISTEDDVKNELNGEEMELTNLFKRYFENELDHADKDDNEFAENIHIIAIIIPTGKCLPMFTSRTRNLQSKQ